MYRINKKFLYSIAYLYLSLPLVIFFLGWFKLYFGIILSLAVVAPLYYCFKNSDYIEINKKEMYQIIASVFSLSIFLILSGIGGYGLQNSDYSKHNAILRDLIDHAWPVIYDQQHGLLVYYLAYYLPSAIIGKMFNFDIANTFQFIWCFIGLAIFTILFFLLIKNYKIRYIFYFILFSGLDIVGQIILKNFPNGLEHIEHWSGIISYQSNITILFWVPQHAISCWLFTVLILNLIESKNKYSVFVYSISIFWSPFIFIGLFPIVLYATFKNGIKKSLNPTNLFIAPLIILMIGLYYRLNGSSASIKFIWNVLNVYFEWPKILLFYFLEFGIYVILIFHKYKEEKDKIFYIIVFSLCVIPLIQMGLYNDFSMRASLPSLTILAIYVLKYLSSTVKYKTILVSLLVCGSLTGMFEISRSLSAYKVKSDEWVSVINAKNKSELNQYVSYDYNTKAFYKIFIKQ